MMIKMESASGGGGANTHNYSLFWDGVNAVTYLYINGELKDTWGATSPQHYVDDYIDISYTTYTSITIVTNKACDKIENYYGKTAYAANATIYNNVRIDQTGPYVMMYAE